MNRSFSLISAVFLTLSLCVTCSASKIHNSVISTKYQEISFVGPWNGGMGDFYLDSLNVLGEASVTVELKIIPKNEPNFSVVTTGWYNGKNSIAADLVPATMDYYSKKEPKKEQHLGPDDVFKLINSSKLYIRKAEVNIHTFNHAH